MRLTSINVVCTHTLGADEAFARLQPMFAGLSSDVAGVKLKRLTWDDDTKTATFTLEFPVGSVSGKALVADKYVQVETDKLPLVAWGPVAIYAHQRIEAALREALK